VRNTAIATRVIGDSLVVQDGGKAVWTARDVKPCLDTSASVTPIFAQRGELDKPADVA
jgi:hypothetical protein